MIKIIDLKFQGLSSSIAAHLVETVEGPVLIETGPHSSLSHLLSGLAENGYQMEDIKHVFITHIHLDHAGAAWAFAEKGATIYMHPRGKKHMVDPSRLLASAKMIYQEKMDQLWGELRPIPESQIRTLGHQEKISVGDTQITAWHTPGHAVHHLSYQIGDILVAGDVAGAKIREDGMVVPPCPPPDIHIEDWIASIEMLETLNLKEIYLSHFGKVQQVKKHFEELKFILWDWANWIRPYYESGTSPKLIGPKFSAYVRQQLIEHGVKEEDLPIYESANPSWMSVGGLMRYWKKKLGADQ